MLPDPFLRQMKKCTTSLYSCITGSISAPIRFVSWGNWWIRCVPKSIFRIGKNILCMNLSDSMYVVLSSNSWCPMKIVTTPIPYSMYLGYVIYTQGFPSLQVGWVYPQYGFDRPWLVYWIFIFILFSRVRRLDSWRKTHWRKKHVLWLKPFKKTTVDLTIWGFIHHISRKFT